MTRDKELRKMDQTIPTARDKIKPEVISSTTHGPRVPTPDESLRQGWVTVPLGGPPGPGFV